MTAPALLSVKDAAAFCGVSPGTFRKLVELGRFPGPVALPIRRRLWSREALERAIMGNVDGWEERRDAWKRRHQDRQAHAR